MVPEDRFLMKKCLGLLGLLLLLTACAGLKPPRPAGFEIYQKAIVEVIPGTVAREEQAQVLRDALVDALEERRVFLEVRPAGVASDDETLLIQATITRLRKSTNVNRIALGRMAGSNVVAADIVLMDGATRRVLGGFALEGESPDYPPGFDWPWGSLQEAMERLARRLAGILGGWKPAAGGS